MIGIGGKTDEYVIMHYDEKETTGKRDFVFNGRLRCKVMRVDQDTKTGITTIDVRAAGVSKVWEKN
jgi:hypothetical protein